MIIIDAADIYKRYGKIDYKVLKEYFELTGETDFHIYIRSNYNHKGFKNSLEKLGYNVVCCESRADSLILKHMFGNMGTIVSNDNRYEIEGWKVFGVENFPDFLKLSFSIIIHG